MNGGATRRRATTAGLPGRLAAEVFLLFARLSILATLLFYEVRLRDLAGESSWFGVSMWAGYWSCEWVSRNDPALEPRQAEFFNRVTRFGILPIMLVVLSFLLF